MQRRNFIARSLAALFGVAFVKPSAGSIPNRGDRHPAFGAYASDHSERKPLFVLGTVVEAPSRDDAPHKVELVKFDRLNMICVRETVAAWYHFAFPGYTLPIGAGALLLECNGRWIIVQSDKCPVAQ